MKKNVHELKAILHFSIICVIFLAVLVSVSVSMFVLNSAEVTAYVKGSTFYENPEPITRTVRTISAKYEQPAVIKRVGVSIGQFAPKESRFQVYVPPRIIPSITIFPVLFDPANPADEIIKVTPVNEQEKEEAASQKEAKAKEEADKKAEERKNIKEAVLKIKSEKTGLFVSPRTGTYITSSIFLGGLILYFLILWLKG